MRQTFAHIHQANSAATPAFMLETRSGVLDDDLDAAAIRLSGDAYATAFDLLTDAVTHGVLNKRLQDHRRNPHRTRLCIDVEVERQSFIETCAFDLQIGFDETQLIVEPHPLVARRFQRIPED